MPAAALRPCRVPRCAGYQTANGYCAAHQELAAARPWETASKSSTDYGTRPDNRHFRRLRDAWMWAHPLCATCGQPGNILDHIQPHRGDRDLFWQQDNWQTLCKLCHDRKTAREALSRKMGAAL